MKAGKASGPDAIPSELCKYFPGPVAKQVYTLMMKSLIQGHEPIDLKGGVVLPIWKGKKQKDVCSAFRSILLSSNIGKAFHKTMRSKQSLVYESYLQHQQLGGRKKVPVVLGTHLTKAFLRAHHALHHATAILFVDLEAAFYTVVRPLALSGTCDDEILACMAAKLHLPTDTVHALYHHFQQPGATESAGMRCFDQRALRAVHTDTFFRVPNQKDVVKTHLGTRPGDAYADIVFGFLMARVLHNFQTQLCKHDVLSTVPDVQTPALFGRPCPTGHAAIPFIGPVWMDDLAVCLWGNTNDAVATKIGVATGVLLDLFREHAMRPNLARGKTELLMTPKGPKSNAWRKRLYGPTATGFFPIVGEAETYQVPVVSSYLHLGSLVHHSGETKQEAKRRVAIANASFNRHRKLVFQNPHIDIVKRTEMFNSLVMSKLSYAMETWTLPDWKSKEYIHAAILRLYRKLLKVDPDEHLSDDMLLTTLDLPSPTEVFRRARLRYVATLLQVGGSACWGLLNQDEAWISLIHDDLRWVWHLLENACDLGEPSAHIEKWIEVMQFHRQYWKRLVRRACRHAILQRKKRFRCQQFYTDMKTILSTNDCWPVPLTQAQTLPKPTSEHTFGCMKCQRSFRSLGARERTCSEPTKL